MRILVVDDDGAICSALRETLAYEGYDVVVAANGFDGLALIADALPNLVLLDVAMPGLSGLDVLAQLHVRAESVPVVMMSALVTSSLRDKALSAGAVDLLEKPFESTERLLTTVRRAIESASPAAIPTPR